MSQRPISIPDPDEAARLVALYSGNPITEAAVTALEAFGADLDPGTAASLLQLWPHYLELTERERAAVVAHFVGNEPDSTSTDVLVSRAIDATLRLTPEQADQVLGLAAHLLFDQVQADEHRMASLPGPSAPGPSVPSSSAAAPAVSSPTSTTPTSTTPRKLRIGTCRIGNTPGE